MASLTVLIVVRTEHDEATTQTSMCCSSEPVIHQLSALNRQFPSPATGRQRLGGTFGAKELTLPGLGGAGSGNSTARCSMAAWARCHSTPGGLKTIGGPSDEPLMETIADAPGGSS